MSLHLYNTLTRRKERFEPKCPPGVAIYTCGPTVYDFAHIGNLRTYVFEDVLCRSLRALGYRVQQIMNLTDVDDKTLRGANRLGQSLNAFTAPFKAAFFADLMALNIVPAAHYPEATAFIPQMIEMIEKLVEGHFAYCGSDGSVYFSIARFAPYGRLSHFCPSCLKVGASQRVQSDEYDKEDATDFVLWKAHDAERDGSIYWDSPWGKGRPGWHIECSAMARHYLGESLDIHAGGVDNIFPHHENELAQSESLSQQPLARFWLHAEHLRVEGRKMSKSAGNFLTLSDLSKRAFDPLAFRLLLLQTHYRAQLNFTWTSLKGAQSALKRLQELIAKLQHLVAEKPSQVTQGDDQRLAHFHAQLFDDLNTSSALAAIFDWARQLNRQLDSATLTPPDAQSALATLRSMDLVLGVLFARDAQGPTQEVIQLMQARQAAREHKLWQRADALRDELRDCGYLVEDSARGPRLKPLNNVD